MNYILFYKEESNFDMHSWIDRFVADYGMGVIIVNRAGFMKSKQLQIYKTIDEAIENNPDYDFVWLDERGDKFLDEYDHKVDKTIYCVGSDYDGFDGKQDLPGEKLRLRFDNEIYASMVIPIICYDRFLYLSGRRK